MMSCFQAQFGQTSLLLLQPFSRFAYLLLGAPLAFASCIDLLQHSGLGDLQPFVRGVAFDLKSRIPARDRGLEFLSLRGLSLTDAFDLFGGIGLKCAELLLQRLPILERLMLRSDLGLQSHLQCRNLKPKCLALLGQRRRHCQCVLPFLRDGSLSLLGIRQGDFQGTTLFDKYRFALFDGGHPQRTHGIGHDGRQIGAEGIRFRAFVFPLFQLVIDRRATALLDDGIDLVDGDFVRPLRAGNELGGGFTRYGRDSGNFRRNAAK